jgi:uncharacterized protein
MDKKESLSIIKKFVEELRGDFSIHNVVFFGSRVEGRARKDSDIDLIIVSDDFEGMSFFRRVAKMYDYWETSKPVDFLCYTVREFERLKNRISIVSEALKEGVLVKV